MRRLDSDNWSVRGSSCEVHVILQAHDIVGMYPVAAAADANATEILDFDKVLHQVVGRVGNENLARSGLRLETLCDIDRITDHRVLEVTLAPNVSGNNLTGVDADANGQAEIRHARYVDAAKFALHLHSSRNRPKRRIRLRDRCAEDDHDSITLKLGQHAFVFETGVDHRREVSVQNVNCLDRIDFSAYGAEAADIREQDGGRAALALQTQRFGFGQQAFHNQRRDAFLE